MLTNTFMRVQEQVRLRFVIGFVIGFVIVGPVYFFIKKINV